ncbi:hypothetical protein TWF694_004564 [Orbilia ellipsospora]|uniref:F-box domain-containing protein n=1 Tax=Orbilia ellipsospora TaxID=2528407 RepID=A0AAV9WWI3_9PEZI
MAQNQPKSIKSLPAKLHEKILSLLPVALQAIALQVCKGWNNIILQSEVLRYTRYQEIVKAPNIPPNVGLHRFLSAHGMELSCKIKLGKIRGFTIKYDSMEDGKRWMEDPIDISNNPLLDEPLLMSTETPQKFAKPHYWQVYGYVEKDPPEDLRSGLPFAITIALSIKHPYEHIGVECGNEEWAKYENLKKLTVRQFFGKVQETLEKPVRDCPASKLSKSRYEICLKYHNDRLGHGVWTTLYFWGSYGQRVNEAVNPFYDSE